MPQVTKILHLDITPERFLEACSPDELTELDLLIQSPRYAKKMAGEKQLRID